MASTEVVYADTLASVYRIALIPKTQAQTIIEDLTLSGALVFNGTYGLEGDSYPQPGSYGVLTIGGGSLDAVNAALAAGNNGFTLVSEATVIAQNGIGGTHFYANFSVGTSSGAFPLQLQFQFQLGALDVIVIWGNPASPTYSYAFTVNLSYTFNTPATIQLAVSVEGGGNIVASFNGSTVRVIGAAPATINSITQGQINPYNSPETDHWVVYYPFTAIYVGPVPDGALPTYSPNGARIAPPTPPPFIVYGPPTVLNLQNVVPTPLPCVPCCQTSAPICDCGPNAGGKH